MWWERNGARKQMVILHNQPIDQNHEQVQEDEERYHSERGGSIASRQTVASGADVVESLQSCR